MTILRVGTDKEFLTIQGAFNSAVSGDTIFIDEGLYEEALYFANKIVNLVANTDYPAEGKVIIKPLSWSTATSLNFNIPLEILYSTSEQIGTMYIEGINFVSAENSFEFSLIRFCQIEIEAASSLKVVFNKCILDFSKSTNYTGGGVVFARQLDTGYPVSSVALFNCKVLWADGDSMIDSEFSLIPEKILNKCILSDHPTANIFGVPLDLCVSGTITSSGVIDPDNMFDDDTNSYGDIAYDSNSWIGYQFVEPQVINQFRVKGNSSGYYGSGFIIKVSTTGDFLGEEDILLTATLAMTSSWYIFNFENSIECTYVRVYSTNTTQPWRISEIEFREVIYENNDYIFIDNENYFQYGPNYSSFITAIPPTHCFSGTVSVNNVPVVRNLKIFRRDNGKLLDIITTSGTTGEYYFESNFGGYHNIVCSDDLSGPDYNDLIKSKCLPKQLPLNYVPVVHTPPYIRTFIMDIADNWGHLNYIGIRSVEFLFEGVVIQLYPLGNYESFSTTFLNANYPDSQAFDTSKSKLGDWTANSWLSDGEAIINQRLICMFSALTQIDTVRINNNHSSGSQLTSGVKNTKIYITPVDISNTEYGAPISGGINIFDGVIPQHVALNVEDPFDINI